jgi:hypothetical protein
MEVRLRSANLAEHRSGGMALFAAGTMVVAVLVVGGVVDFMSLAMQKHDVQDAADAAALGAVREIQIAMNDGDRLKSVAEAIALANLSTLKDIKVETTATGEATLEVVITAAPRVFFPGVIGMTAKRVSAKAIAEISGSQVCMIGLDPKVKRTLHMQKKAAITAKDCAIYSNSTSPEGIFIEGNANVAADFICSAGGVKVDRKMSLDPAPLVDCPTMSDPLASRPPPSVGACDHKKTKIDKGKTEKLYPGVYCEGIEIRGTVSLAPGVYIIKNGSLKVKDGGVLTGEHAGFFLTGEKTLIEFEKDSTIELSAPRTGPLAGLLFFEDRNVVAADSDKVVAVDEETGLPKAQEHRIRSDNARELVGTIYIPRNRLLIDGDKPIAAESAYTVIIAREFVLAEGPEVVLNAHYESTDVPVPQGVGNKSDKSARLIR